MSEEDKAALVARAEALGIDVDKRWGVSRLASEIAKAEAAQAVPAPEPVAEANPSDEAPAAEEPALPDPVEDVPSAPVEAAPEAPPAGPALLIPTEGEPDFNDPGLDGRCIVEAALSRQQAE